MGGFELTDGKIARWLAGLAPVTWALHLEGSMPCMSFRGEIAHRRGD